MTDKIKNKDPRLKFPEAHPNPKGGHMNQPTTIKLKCLQCNKFFEVDLDRRPRPYICTKKCYEKYHGVKL